MCVFPSQLKYCMFLSPILPERGCINICTKVCHVISCSSSNSVCVTEHCSVQIGERERLQLHVKCTVVMNRSLCE